MTMSPAPADAEAILLPPLAGIPNNPRLPVLLYRGVFPREGDRAAAFERLFAMNGWGDGWRDGIYTEHHFHTCAHEALGIAAGSARLCLGGPDGRELTVSAGDVVVLPAGTGHRNLSSSSDFLVVGAYPPGQEPDMNWLGQPVPDGVADRVRAVPLPTSDPIYGHSGPLIRLWGPQG